MYTHCTASRTSSHANLVSVSQLVCLIAQQVDLKGRQQSTGNSAWKALRTTAEPHAMKLVNDELILVRLSDGAILDRITKPEG
jgi:hypothetical protein